MTPAADQSTVPGAEGLPPVEDEVQGSIQQSPSTIPVGGGPVGGGPVGGGPVGGGPVGGGPPDQGNEAPLLTVRDLVKHYPLRHSRLFANRAVVKAVDGVSFDIAQGETLGLVGESGGGKTTVGLSVLRLVQPTSGSVVMEGHDVVAADRASLKQLRRRMQIVFQDPIAALDPRKRVVDSVAEGVRVQRLAAASTAREMAGDTLNRVGLTHDQADAYPHELSGGQLQRVGIARALVVSPSLVVCDEPVSALDVSIQAQIVNLLLDLQDEHSLSYLFVTHDLGLVRHISHRVAVMYLGRIVEVATAEAIFDAPAHPYTRALLSAMPTPEPGTHRRRIVLQGEPPSPTDPPSGCHFVTRCPHAMPRCASEAPRLSEIAPGHWASCFLND